MVDRPWGRMRVRKDQALLYYRLLWEERGRVSLERSRWKNQPDAMHGFNRALALIDASKDELERLASEQGWELRGQLRSFDAQATDPGETGR